MISKFIFNGKSSEDFGILVEKLPNSIHGGRRVETYTIPGRHGSRRRNQKAYDNYPEAYEICFRDRLSSRDVYQISRDIAAWLLTAPDDARFEDTYEPDIYRLASYTGPLDVEVALRTAGKAVLEFDFQPQRFLKSGEQEVEITDEITTLHNPTAYSAAPLIKVSMESEAEEIIPVDVPITLTSGKYIGNNRMSASSVHRVISVSYPNCSVSQEIDVSGYEAAIISTECFRPNPYDMRYSWGLEMATCYTLLTSSGKPISKIVDYRKMDAVRIPIPTKAKRLYICVANDGGTPIMTPSVTLIPKPSNAGTGSVTINGRQAEIEFADRSTIYLDCESHNAYFEDGSNANYAVTFLEADNPYPTFPLLEPGENQVSLSASQGAEITASIKPRWWQL